MKFAQKRLFKLYQSLYKEILNNKIENVYGKNNLDEIQKDYIQRKIWGFTIGWVVDLNNEEWEKDIKPYRAIKISLADCSKKQKDIAEAMKVPENNIKDYMHRACEEIRTHVLIKSEEFNWKKEIKRRENVSQQ